MDQHHGLDFEDVLLETVQLKDGGLVPVHCHSAWFRVDGGRVNYTDCLRLDGGALDPAKNKRGSGQRGKAGAPLEVDPMPTSCQFTRAVLLTVASRPRCGCWKIERPRAAG
jgi:hypothetical protein